MIGMPWLDGAVHFTTTSELTFYVVMGVGGFAGTVAQIRVSGAEYELRPKALPD